MTTVHPAAELFPLMEGADFERLVQSMRESGYDPDVIADLVADLLAQLAEATEQIRRLEDQLTEKSFELERVRTESEYRLLRLQRGEVRTGERRDVSNHAGLIYDPRCGKDRRQS